MRREHRVSDRVFAQLYPHRRSTDPQSFTDHLNTNLVAEVRIETQRFYGGLETVEARYPGLNYTHYPHIKRLSYFPFHKKLFEAFDVLGLTDSEILSLCRWEGTLWARQRYEKDEGVRVVDTTGDEIGPWVPHEQRSQSTSRKYKVVATVDSSGRVVRTSLNSRTTASSFPNRRSVGANTTSTAAGSTQNSADRLTIAQLLEQQIQRPQSASVADAGAASQQHQQQQPEERGDVVMRETPTNGSPDLFPPSAHHSSAVHHHHRRTSLEQHADHSDGPLQLPASLSPTDMLQRMHALAILRARGETIDPSDPAFEQYLKETAESSSTEAAASVGGGGYGDAAAIASVMSGVAAQGQVAVAAAQQQQQLEQAGSEVVNAR